MKCSPEAVYQYMEMVRSFPEVKKPKSPDSKPKSEPIFQKLSSTVKSTIDKLQK